MNFDDGEQPINNNDGQSGMTRRNSSPQTAASQAKRMVDGAAWHLDGRPGSTIPAGADAAEPPVLLRNFYIPAVPIRHLEGVLQEQLEIYHHKIQRAIDRIPDEAILTQQLVGEVWRGRVFVMGFFRAVEYILAASRDEWSFFDPRARLHYKVHDARWEADLAAHDAIELIAAKRSVKE